MEDKFMQQLKRGILELLVLHLICRKPAYGYELLTQLRDDSDGLFTLKEGTLYPILYRLEDDGLIAASWLAGEGRTAPKKIYTATESGRTEIQRRKLIWQQFYGTVNTLIGEAENHET